MSLRSFGPLLLASCLLVAACGSQSSPVLTETTNPPTSTTASGPSTSVTTSTTLAPTTTSAPAVSSVVSTKGLVYAIGSWLDAPVEWKADFHRPLESGVWPVLVFFPGQGQGPNAYYNLAEEIAAHGVAVLVMDYADRSPTALANDDARGYREVAELAGCALRFAHHEVETAGSVPGTVGVGGMSLGAGAAAHAALAGESLDALWDEFLTGRELPRLMECVAEEGSTHVDALVGVAGAYRENSH